MTDVTRDRSEGAPLPMVWHVGRHGEVAGGMTQVVNGYLAWSFRNTHVGVIVPRDGSSGLRALWLFARAARHVLALDPAQSHVVVVHLSQGGSFWREGFLLKLARRRGLGVVAHLHGSSFVEFAGRRPGLVRSVLQRATKIIVLSEATRKAVADLVPSARTELVPNAVPSAPPAAKTNTIVFGGSVSRRKGIDVLLRAWQDIGASSGWKLVIAGPHTEPDLVSCLPEGCEAPGPLSHARLMQLLDTSRIAVLPSRDEAMPMFILEAMARRNCVVSTRVGGIPAVLEGGRGVLIEPGDAQALGAELHRIMHDAAHREQLAAEGNRFFERNFSAEAVYPRVEAVWLAALSRPAGG